MKRHLTLGIISAAVGLSGLLAGTAYAVPSLDAANHAQWDEGAYYNGFGGPLPAGIVEGSAGFSTIGDYDGRVLANAGVTTNKTDSTVLTTISTGLFAGSDANLYKIQITNPATFSASIPSTTLILALFDGAGNGKAASIGGAADAITGANAGLTTPGIYYIGIADSPLYPENNESQNLFGLAAGTPGVFTPAAGITDLALSTNAFTAWTLPSNQTTLLTNTSFTAPSSTITLSGANFAVVPEPTSLGLISTLSLGLLARRRKQAR